MCELSPRGNGLEAWRRLVPLLKHDDVDSSIDLKEAIMGFAFSNALDEDQLTDLDLLVQKYEKRCQDVIADSVLRGIMRTAFPNP